MKAIKKAARHAARAANRRMIALGRPDTEYYPSRMAKALDAQVPTGSNQIVRKRRANEDNETEQDTLQPASEALHPSKRRKVTSNEHVLGILDSNSCLCITQ
jgi:hypothetical protein